MPDPNTPPGEDKQGIEESIEAAIRRGDFDNLPGKGKPLDLDEYFNTPEDVRLGFSLLKSAGFVPDEVALLKEIEVLKEELAACSDLQEKNRINRAIQDRQLKFNLGRERYTKRGG